jgi:uncharacterized OsmC-like protein
VIKRIHVRFRLKARAADQETAQRVHGFFAENCPVYRSLKGSIAMTTEVAFQPEE